MTTFEKQQPPADIPLVRGITASGFRIAGHIYDQPLLLYRSNIYQWPDAQLVQAGALLSLANLDPKPELLIIGSGAQMQRADASLIDEMKRHGINVDVMDSRSAARTYNLLVLEGRRVAVALLPPNR